MSAKIATTCPSWCPGKCGELGIHVAYVGHADGASVALVLCPPASWDPQPVTGVHLAADGTSPGDHGFRVDVKPALSVAAFLEGLGHKELAALVRKAVETASAGSGRCAS